MACADLLVVGLCRVFGATDCRETACDLYHGGAIALLLVMQASLQAPAADTAGGACVLINPGWLVMFDDAAVDACGKLYNRQVWCFQFFLLLVAVNVGYWWFSIDHVSYADAGEVAALYFKHGLMLSAQLHINVRVV